MHRRVVPVILALAALGSFSCLSTVEPADDSGASRDPRTDLGCDDGAECGETDGSVPDAGISDDGAADGGVPNACPVATAEARVAGSFHYGEFPDEERRLTLRLPATLELRGENSMDPDGFVPGQGYEWTVAERPAGSTAALSPSETARNPSVDLDQAGTYVFRLQVTDQRGLLSCEDARVVVEALPKDDLRIELVWDTPGDLDQTDQGYGAGADLDLHLLHPLGDWFDSTYDCYADNRSPDWGVPGVASDDPIFERDDLDGAGPETIPLRDPEVGRVYRVGVHYVADHGYGPSLATVRIFIRGVLAFEAAGRHLPSTRYFWDVATISWPDGEIRSVDTVLDSVPDGF